ncbi:MAG: polysaccharide biosynthesis tyrosine autokinase [Hyphomicrobiales bacterium]|nr:polysaccharide biosynthesis tyrosine autokinase [Hyphomicrobiales bacterium]
MNRELIDIDTTIVDLRELIRMVWRRWQVIAGTVGVGVGAALFYLVTATPLYTASTTILIEPRKQNILDAEAVVSGFSTDTAAIESEVELIKSSSMAKRVIAKLDLDRDPEFGGRPTPSRSLFSTIASWLGLSDAEAEASAKEQKVPEEVLNGVVGSFSGHLDVTRIGATYVLEVSFTSRRPDKAARIANQIADSYLVDQLEAKYDATKRATQWLNDRLASIRAEVQQSEKLVGLYKAKHGLQSTAGQTLDERQMASLNEQLILARADTAGKLARYEHVEKLIKAGKSKAELAAVLQSEVISNLRAQQSEVGRQLAELTTRYGGKHPKVVNMRAEYNDISRQISTEVGRIVADLKNEYEVALTRERSLQESLNEIKRQNDASNQAAIKLDELERDAEANRTLYESFLTRFKQTSEQETLKTTDVRIITAAVPPSKPSYPKKKLTLTLALAGFSALGLGLAFLLEYLDNSFKTGEQIEEVLRIPHLTMVPLLAKSDTVNESGGPLGIQRYVVERPLSSYTEAIRALKVGIQISNVDSPPRSILVTSALPNEGKTTIAANLAYHAASTGLNVLLIDADLRHPSLSTHLARGKGEDGGLVELLARQATETDVIRRDLGARIDVLPTSQRLQDSAEILGSQRMKDLVRRTGQAYDLVILDSSPISPVVDARILSTAVDSIVLVVEWDKTPREAVQAAIKSMGLDKRKLAGVVLNKVNMKRMANYSHYMGKYFHQQYPYYYGTDG